MFSEKNLKKGLKTSVFGKRMYTFATIDSTNACAKTLASCDAEDGTIVIAEEQTAGKGRFGRSWQSSPNQNLTFSLIIRPEVGQAGLNLLPLYVAVAIAEAIERITDLTVDCKWPNDLLIKKKKVAGILIEGSLQQEVLEYVVIGIGINVNQQKFSAELSGKATSLRRELGDEVDRAALLREILFSLENHYRKLVKTSFQSILPLWLSRTTMLNKTVSISEQGVVISGVMKGLSAEGGLVLQTPDAERILFAGDVTIVGT